LVKGRTFSALKIISVSLVTTVVACGCTSGPETGDAFDAANSRAVVGMASKPGSVVTLGGVILSLPAGTSAVTIEAVTPVGGQMSDEVAKVHAVGLYDTQEGVIGADDSLKTATDMEKRRILAFPVELSSARREVGVILILDVLRVGTWRSDYFEIRYKIAGDQFVEQVTAGNGLCATTDPTQECDVGKPAWWS
jgi:hypothetical protein